MIPLIRILESVLELNLKFVLESHRCHQMLTGHPGCGIFIYGGVATRRLSLSLVRAQPFPLVTAELLVINNSFLPFCPPRDVGFKVE